MKIIVASKNPVKIEAVKEVIQEYDFLKDAEIIACETNSGVSAQPKSLEETIEGAMQRAKNVFADCDYSFGIESGLIEVHYKQGAMNVTVCSVHNGTKHSLGFSSGFIIPPEIDRLIREQNIDIDQACYAAQLTAHKKIGSAEGIIGLLTKGRVPRKEYTKQAIQMALIPFENQELYKVY